MSKAQIHQLFIEHLGQELETILSAAKKTYATATDEEHHAEHKYDTFSLESSYLARGQAMRAEQLASAAQALTAMTLPIYDTDALISEGILVRIKAEDGNVRTLFLGPVGGGETITYNDETITLVTTESPIGACVEGKKVGDNFDLKLGPDSQSFEIISAE